MEFKELILKRYSVRKFDEKPIEEEKLEQVLNAARMAPSAVNFQPYKLYVIKSEEKLKEIKACYHRSWIEKAPVIIAVVGLHDMGWKRGEDMKDHTDIDAAIAIDHLTLQAADLDLGTCWVCNFDVEMCSTMLDLTGKEEPIALIPIGYPLENNVPVKKRKGLDEIVVWM